MDQATTERDGWHPQSAQDRTAVMLELQEIVASPHFRNSKRYPALLQYIVKFTLAGKFDLLKERTLGVEVFDRPPDYDTNVDTVVRYTAGEVRKRLLLYYSERGRSSGIRISLPAGSYIPKFLNDPDDMEEWLPGRTSSAGTHIPNADAITEPANDKLTVELTQPPALAVQPQPTTVATRFGPWSETAKRPAARRLLFAFAAVILIAVPCGLIWKSGSAHSQKAVDDFWGPVVREQHPVVVCPGGVVFAGNNYSGVTTAGKDIQYPFVSVQIASAISQISGFVERLGATTQLQAAPSTGLPELREHSIVLLGGYNNQWTMRLLDPLRFHFTPEPVESIVDRAQPQAHWSRDRSIPYSSADDYALVARYRDTTTDSWVVVLAGLGRNGTEAAAQFVTSPHYMQLLREQLGSDFSNRNIEFLLRVQVIDGKTGAPSIQAIHTW